MIVSSNLVEKIYEPPAMSPAVEHVDARPEDVRDVGAVTTERRERIGTRTPQMATSESSKATRVAGRLASLFAVRCAIVVSIPPFWSLLTEIDLDRALE